MWFAFFTLIPLQAYSGISQRVGGMWYHKGLSGEADVRTQLSLIKLDVKEIYQKM